MVQKARFLIYQKVIKIEPNFEVKNQIIIKDANGNDKELFP